jgi:hypothetical protein
MTKAYADRIWIKIVREITKENYGFQDSPELDISVLRVLIST